MIYLLIVFLLARLPHLDDLLQFPCNAQGVWYGGFAPLLRFSVSMSALSAVFVSSCFFEIFLTTTEVWYALRWKKVEKRCLSSVMQCSIFMCVIIRGPRSSFPWFDNVRSNEYQKHSASRTNARCRRLEAFDLSFITSPDIWGNYDSVVATGDVSKVGAASTHGQKTHGSRAGGRIYIQLGWVGPSPCGPRCNWPYFLPATGSQLSSNSPFF